MKMKMKMKMKNVILLVGSLSLFITGCETLKPKVAEQVKRVNVEGVDGRVYGHFEDGSVIVAGLRRIFEFDHTGKNIWSIKAGNCHDV